MTRPWHGGVLNPESASEAPQPLRGVEIKPRRPCTCLCAARGIFSAKRGVSKRLVRIQRYERRTCSRIKNISCRVHPWCQRVCVWTAGGQPLRCARTAFTPPPPALTSLATTNSPPWRESCAFLSFILQYHIILKTTLFYPTIYYTIWVTAAALPLALATAALAALAPTALYVYDRMNVRGGC